MQVAQALGLPEEIVVHVLAMHRRKKYSKRIKLPLNQKVYEFLLQQAMFGENFCVKEQALKILRNNVA